MTWYHKATNDASQKSEDHIEHANKNAKVHRAKDKIKSYTKKIIMIIWIVSNTCNKNWESKQNKNK